MNKHITLPCHTRCTRHTTNVLLRLRLRTRPSINNGADSMGHGGTCPPLLQMARHGGHREYRRTANKKLTKLYWPWPKRLPKRLIVLLEPKSGGGVIPKKFFPALRGAPVPPTFKFVPAPLSINRHCRRHPWICSAKTMVLYKKWVKTKSGVWS